jgi:hypothetical protein
VDAAAAGGTSFGLAFAGAVPSPPVPRRNAVSAARTPASAAEVALNSSFVEPAGFAGSSPGDLPTAAERTTKSAAGAMTGARVAGAREGAPSRRATAVIPIPASTTSPAATPIHGSPVLLRRVGETTECAVWLPSIFSRASAPAGGAEGSDSRALTVAAS